MPERTKIVERVGLKKILAPRIMLTIGITTVIGASIALSVILLSPTPFACPAVTASGFGQELNTVTAKQNLAELDALTRQLFKRTSEYNKSAKQNKADLKSIQQVASVRKQLFTLVMGTDAKAASLAVLLSSQRNDLRDVATNCIERSVRLKGRLEILHADGQPGDSSVELYSLVTDQGRKQLHFINGVPPGASAGSTIELTGLALDNEILLDGTAPLDEANAEFGGMAITPMTVDSTTMTPTLKKTLALLANFSNTNASNPTIGQVEDVINNQVDDFYRENSYNRLSYDGTARGWFTVPAEQSCFNFWPESDLVQGAIQAAKKADPELKFTEYSQLLIVAPLGAESCPYGGFGTLGSVLIPTPDGPVTMGLSVIQDFYVNLYSVGHEFGHNLGNNHAAFLNCGATTLGSPPGISSCPVWEYGDLTDIMGASIGRHFNAIHKEAIGWLSSDNVHTVTTSGRYTLAPIETSSIGLQALKIRRGPGSDLWLEYRQPIGFDAGNYFNSTNGLRLNLADSTIPAKSFLLDPTPPTESTSVNLLVGQTYTDPMTGTTITTVAQTPTEVTVDVTVGTVYRLPNVQLTSQLPKASVTGMISLTATADDEDGIDRVEFYAAVSGRPPRLIGTDVTSPYEISWNTELFPNGPNYVYATAVDSSGAMATTKSVGVNVDNVDPTPPIDVVITIPVSGASLYSPITVTADAKEDRGIYKIEILPDGCDGYIPKCGGMTTWQVPYLASLQLFPGPHTVRARAYNMVGGSTTSTDISFTVLADTEVPIISITNPVTGSYLRGSSVVNIHSSDNIQVKRVEWWLDDQSPKISHAADVVMAIDTTGLSDGEHILTVMAYDTSENSTTATVKFTIDNTLPSITLTQPADGTTVSKVVTIVTSATDAIGIRQVNFYRDDQVLIGTQTLAECKLRPKVCGYSIPWNTKKATIGTHLISAKVIDLAGNETQTIPIRVTVVE